ncbi:MAG: SDR family oxidoreductase [Saprospiraceae bacterium]|nr:SDR family oxidoreductase [Saprospiraceae bacterium]
MNFSNKVVLVTGGSRGIGAAISEAFAKRGAKVAINYHNNDQRAIDCLESLQGTGHHIFKADIADEAACATLVDKVVDRYGRIDILINNAGIHEKHPIDEVDYENWNRIFHETLNTNLLAPARLMFLVSAKMMSQGGGRIVNISSRGAFRGEPDQPAYGASKAGLNALSQSLAQKLAPYGIYIGVVAPGFVETDMVKDLLDSPAGELIRGQSPFKRVARPEEVAYTALFLASDEATWNSGAIIDVNGASYLRT